MHSQVQKWGNSLGIRIPKALAKKLNLHSGSDVELEADNDHIVISKKYSELDQMLERINNNNIHHEAFENDNPKGKEVW